MIPVKPAVGNATGPAVGLGRSTASGGGGGPAERVQNGNFSSATGWDTSGASWAIAAGVATNAVVGPTLTNTLSTPLVGGETFDLAFEVIANPASTGMACQLFNSSTLATQTIFSDGTTTGLKTASGTVSGAFDQLRFGASDDAGLVIDNVSLLA